MGGFKQATTLTFILLTLSLFAAGQRPPQNAPRPQPTAPRPAPPNTAPNAASNALPKTAPPNMPVLPPGVVLKVPPQRIGWMNAYPKPLFESAPLLQADVSRARGTALRLWRGVSPSLSEAVALPPQWAQVGARLAQRSAPLLRVTPFSANGVLTAAPDGSPIVQWERPDQMLTAGASAGTRFILTFLPPGNLSPETWERLLTLAAQRYGEAEKYGVARWELATSAEGAQRWYPIFARTIRKAQPTAPLGFYLSSGDIATELKGFANLCATNQLPLDSVSWHQAGNATLAAINLNQIRNALATYPALKRTVLLPELGAEGDVPTTPSQIALLYRALLDYSAQNPTPTILGVLAAQPALWTADGRPTPLWNTFALLNRLSGALVPLRAPNGVQGVVVRSGGNVSALVWSEPGSKPSPVVLRLKGLARPPKSVYRLTLSSVALADAPLAVTDIPEGKDELDIPLLLSPDEPQLLELAPLPKPPPLSVTISPKESSGYGGETREFVITFRNNSAKPVALNWEAQGSLPGVTKAGGSRFVSGKIAPNEAKAFFYRGTPAVFGQDATGFLFVRAGEQGCGAAAFPVRAPVTASLAYARIDLPGPASVSKAALRLTNRARGPLSISLHTDRTEGKPFDLPGGGKTYVRDVEVASPSGDPGVYPSQVEVRTESGLLSRLTLLLGVPANCRYTLMSPSVDGDLSEWTDAEPMGMGRKEQAKGRAWRGPGDLSAIAYAKWDEENFYFACSVTDDAAKPPNALAELWKADSVQFALSGLLSTPPDREGYAPGDHEFGMALLKDGTSVLARFAAPPEKNGAVPGAKIAVRRLGTRTSYEALIPWKALKPIKPEPGTLFRLSILVNDDDGQGRVYMEWGGGIAGSKRPGVFPPIRLVR